MNRGVARRVVSEMENLNREKREQVIQQQQDDTSVIGRPPTATTK